MLVKVLSKLTGYLLRSGALRLELNTPYKLLPLIPKASTLPSTLPSTLYPLHEIRFGTAYK